MLDKDKDNSHQIVAYLMMSVSVELRKWRRKIQRDYTIVVL